MPLHINMNILYSIWFNAVMREKLFVKYSLNLWLCMYGHFMRIRCTGKLNKRANERHKTIICWLIFLLLRVFEPDLSFLFVYILNFADFYKLEIRIWLFFFHSNFQNSMENGRSCERFV